MARTKNTTGTNKTLWIQIRVSEEEKAKIDLQAAKHKMKTGAYLRKLAEMDAKN